MDLTSCRVAIKFKLKPTDEIIPARINGRGWVRNTPEPSEFNEGGPPGGRWAGSKNLFLVYRSLIRGASSATLGPPSPKPLTAHSPLKTTSHSHAYSHFTTCPLPICPLQLFVIHLIPPTKHSYNCSTINFSCQRLILQFDVPKNGYNFFNHSNSLF